VLLGEGADLSSPGISLLIRSTRYEVHDVSARGIGALVPDDVKLEEDERGRLDATILVGDIQIGMRVRLVNRHDMHVGYEITDAEPSWHETVRSLLDPVFLGRRLREIDQRFVEPDHRGNLVRWFQSGPGCDLFIWYSRMREFLCAQLFFMGQVVEWSAQHGTRTGKVAALPKPERGWAQSELFHLHTPPDEEAVTVARRILKAAALPAEIRGLLPLSPPSG
jgi:hypothetical protein